MPEMRQGDDDIKVAIEEWQPGSEATDREFFDAVMPRLKAIKEGRLRNLECRAPLSEEAIQKSLVYLESRLRALKEGDSVPLARIGHEIVGYLLMRWEESEERSQLEQFYVEGKYRSQGIGSKLLAQAVQHAKTSHTGESRGIFLTTGETNEGAQRLYGRFGFRPSEKMADEEGEVRLELDF